MYRFLFEGWGKIKRPTISNPLSTQKWLQLLFSFGVPDVARYPIFIGLIKQNFRGAIVVFESVLRLSGERGHKGLQTFFADVTRGFLFRKQWSLCNTYIKKLLTPLPSRRSLGISAGRV